MSSWPCKTAAYVTGNSGTTTNERPDDFGVYTNFPNTVTPRSTFFSSLYLRATEDQKVAEMENCLAQTKGWLELLYVKYKACITASGTKNDKDTCTTQKTTCDTAQHDFEISRCWWAVDHDFHCHSYVHCVETELAADKCKYLCRDVRALTERNKRDYETGERIQCLLESLFGTPNPSWAPDVTFDATNSTTWPLTPRQTNNTLLLTDDDATAEWVKFCHGESSAYTQAQVVSKFYFGGATAPTAAWAAAGVDVTNTSNVDITFDHILDYEKRYFDLKCTGDNNANDVAHASSRMFGLRLPIKTSGSPDVVYTLSEMTNVATATAVWDLNNYVKNPRTSSSPFGLGYADCTSGGLPNETNYNMTAGYLQTESGVFSVTNDASNQWCNEMVDLNTLKYSLNLQTQWTNFNDGAHGQTTAAAGSAWHANSAGNAYDGGVLYLTKQAQALGFSNHPSGGFDCTELPVPGETANCARGEISRYPYRGCWADVYRSDSLRVEVPFCDDGTITALSHASFFLGQVEDYESGGSTSKGCAAAYDRVNKAGALASSQTGCQADTSVTSWVQNSGSYFDTSGRHGNTNYDHADSIIGTCCVDYTGISGTAFSSNRDSTFDPNDSDGFREAYPDSSVAYTTYDCLGKYMFTHAEREAAFGSDKQVGNNYYGATSNADLTGFNTGDSGSVLGYWHPNNEYSDTFSAATVNTTGDLTSQTVTNLNDKNEWSISSDIQGYYKVVASTETLGTQCNLRALTGNTGSYERRGNTSKIASGSVGAVFSQS